MVVHSEAFALHHRSMDGVGSVRVYESSPVPLGRRPRLNLFVEEVANVRLALFNLDSDTPSTAIVSLPPQLSIAVPLSPPALR